MIGCVESFIRKVRDEYSNEHAFLTLHQARMATVA